MRGTRSDADTPDVAPVADLGETRRASAGVVTAEGVSSNHSARRRWLGSLFWILLIPVVAFGVGQGVHIKYQADLIAAVEQDVGRTLTPEERATVGIDAYCADPQSAGDSACGDLAIATLVEGGAVVALIVGLLLLAFTSLAGVAARRDRSALLRLFRPGLVVTLLGLAVLVLLDGLLAVGAIYLGLGVFAGRIAPVLLLAVAAGAAIGAFGIVRALLRISRRPTTRVLGRPLDRTVQPRLHAFIDDLAQELGAERPENVVAGLDPEFYVTEVDVETLDRTCTGRTLYLSLPLSRILSATELRAVLGHELGHFRGRDTRFSRDFYPIYRGASESVEALATGAGRDGGRALPLIPAMMLIGAFIDAFAGPERALSRERELVADQAGAEATSPADVASALVKLSAFTRMWPRTVDALVEAGRASKPLENASSLFVMEVRAAAGPAALDGLEASSLAHPTDSHPPLHDRLLALEVGLESVSAAALDVAPASAGIDLMDDPDRLEDELTALARDRIARAFGAPAGSPQPA